MASKKNKELSELKEKYERLECKYSRLIKGEPIRKVHFNMDGENTACGIHLFEHDVDESENMADVTCKVCMLKWEQKKNKWDHEQLLEEAIKRRIERNKALLKEEFERERMKNG